MTETSVSIDHHHSLSPTESPASSSPGDASRCGFGSENLRSLPAPAPPSETHQDWQDMSSRAAAPQVSRGPAVAPPRFGPQLQPNGSAPAAVIYADADGTIRLATSAEEVAAATRRLAAATQQDVLGCVYCACVRSGMYAVKSLRRHYRVVHGTSVSVGYTGTVT